MRPVETVPRTDLVLVEYIQHLIHRQLAAAQKLALFFVAPEVGEVQGDHRFFAFGQDLVIVYKTHTAHVIFDHFKRIDTARFFIFFFSETHKIRSFPAHCGRFNLRCG